MTNTPDTNTAPVSEDSAAEFTGTATYCPEDNKLRLYVGRVPRPEYLALRAEGWTSTPKQDCDFVAVWTPERRATALRYAGVIDDEDAGPADRAADRAERFAGYREKRLGEATGHADRYEARPAVHGFQSLARAERAAARHDRIGSHAVDAWDKAEYWQSRTSRVISHALHLSSPSVRMGRIKEIESEIRKREKERAEFAELIAEMHKVAALTDAAQQDEAARFVVGNRHGLYWLKFTHPRLPEVRETLSDLMRHRSDPITGAEAAAVFLARFPQQSAEGPWLTHYRNRLAYENQMLEAQGGRAGVVEMVAGGWLRGGRHLSNEERQIVKVNRSNATGRVVSVLVRDNHPSSVNHYGNPFPEGVSRVLSHTVEIERASPDCYRPPTPEEAAAFAEKIQGEKARAKAAKVPCPLINPTDADAERLQTLWNERGRIEHARAVAERRTYGEFTPAAVVRISQATYSAASKGSYARAETRGLHANAELSDRFSNLYSRHAEERAARIGKPVCHIRQTSGGSGYYTPQSVIVITDKPQKSLPAAVWAPFVPEATEATATASDELALA